MNLYILGRSAYISGTQPIFELFVTENDKMLYLGHGPRLAVELIKKVIQLTPQSQVIELDDVSNDNFTRILDSCGFGAME